MRGEERRGEGERGQAKRGLAEDRGEGTMAPRSTQWPIISATSVQGFAMGSITK